LHILSYRYTNFCGNAQFLFKTDDDIYLHIPNMINMFASTTMYDSIICHRNKSRKVLRSLSDIHYFVYSLKNQKNQKGLIQQIKAKFNKYLIGYDKLPGEKK